MSITYSEAEAQKRILDAMSDGAGFKHLAQEAMASVRCLFEQAVHHIPRREQSTDHTDTRPQRVVELKAIMQHSHPDKPGANLLVFHAAKRELEALRRQMRCNTH